MLREINQSHDIGATRAGHADFPAGTLNCLSFPADMNDHAELVVHSSRPP